MAISFVGSTSAIAIDSGNATIDLTAITGLAEGDVVYIGGGHPSRTIAAGVSSAGWTNIIDHGVATGGLARIAVDRKIMGSVPDTSAICRGTGVGTTSGCAYVAIALRGVDQTTPEDATRTVAEALDANSQPSGPSITTVTGNAWILSFALITGSVHDLTVTAPAGFSNKVNNSADDATDAVVGGATKLVPSAGPALVGAWSGFTTTANSDWAAVTVAVRPGVLARTVTASGSSYSLTGGAASLEMGREVAGGAAAYNLTGGDGSLERGLKLVGTGSSYALTGSTAELVYLAGKGLAAEAGTYTLAGFDPDTIAGRFVGAVSENYTLAGSAAGFFREWNIIAAGGSYAHIGPAVGLRRTLNMAAAGSSYVLTGGIAEFDILVDVRFLPAEGGSYSLNGTDAALIFYRPPRRGQANTSVGVSSQASSSVRASQATGSVHPFVRVSTGVTRH